MATITAFTIAHSLTLAAATLGFVHVPQAPIEATIALSIMFVACEIVHSRQGQPGLTERWPWLVAFVFGLLHGFGFASALSEVGLPQYAIPELVETEKSLMNQATVTKNYPVTEAVREALAVSQRGADELLPMQEWSYKLARSAATGMPLRIKLGLDPTAPDIHIGHTVVLNKMRQLQDLGHAVIFLFGFHPYVLNLPVVE